MDLYCNERGIETRSSKNLKKPFCTRNSHVRSWNRIARRGCGLIDRGKEEKLSKRTVCSLFSTRCSRMNRRTRRAIIELRLKARNKSNEGIKWTDRCKSSRLLYDTLRYFFIASIFFLLISDWDRSKSYNLWKKTDLNLYDIILLFLWEERNNEIILCMKLLSFSNDIFDNFQFNKV